MRSLEPIPMYRMTTALAAGLITLALLPGQALAEPSAPPAKPVAAKLDAAKTDAAKPVAAKPDAAKTDAAKPATPDRKTREAARKAFTGGEKSMKAGDTAKALEQFQAAQSLIPSPIAAYWVAACLDKLGRSADALEAYQALLADPQADKAGAERIAEVKARVEQLSQTVPGEVAVSAGSVAAMVTVDGQAQNGETPLTLRLTPGSHKLVVAAVGRLPKELSITVVAGKKEQASVELEEPPPPPPPPVAAAPPPPPPPAPPPPPPPPSKVPAYVTLGIAGVSAGVGTYFGVRALSAKSDYDSHPTSARADRVENNALVADMAFGVAVTLGVTGVVLLTSSDDASQTAAARQVLAPRRLSIAPWATLHSGGAAARLSF